MIPSFFVGAVNVFVVWRIFRCFDKFILALKQEFVAFACIARKQDELARVVAERKFVLGLFRFTFYAGTGMCQTGDHAHQQGFSGLFGESEAVVNHVVGFLLVAGFEHWDQCEITVEAAVLFVL